ncbi:MAG: ytfJ [Firmicutes bacterium]|nr:ytfJ [Bacillota bacterium]
MVDVNTIVGDAVESADGTVIIPISRVTFGFAAGGSDFNFEEEGGEHDSSHPFGGGSGGGVSVKPSGFLVCSPKSGIRFMPVEGNVLYDRVIDMVPQFLTKIQEISGEFIHPHDHHHKEPPKGALLDTENTPL